MNDDRHINGIGTEPSTPVDSELQAAAYENTKRQWIKCVKGEGWIESFVQHVLCAPPEEVAESLGYLTMLESILSVNPNQLIPRSEMAQWEGMPEWWRVALFTITPVSRLEMRRVRGDIEEMRDLALGAMRYGLTPEGAGIQTGLGA